MGGALRKPVAADDWESIYCEALRLEASFIKTHDVSTKRIIFNQWMTIRSWGFLLLEKSNPQEANDKKEALHRIHANIINHNDESFLQTRLLESS
jgi:hypothetical protein